MKGRENPTNYRLSGLGQRALRLEAERLERQVSLARLKQVLDGAD